MASLEGWIVLRYTVVQMDNPEGMIAQVRRAIESRRVGVA